MPYNKIVLQNDEPEHKLSLSDLAATGLRVFGGMGGMAGGAALGTAIAPGPGTLIGSILGGAIGGGGGEAVAEKLEGKKDFNKGRIAVETLLGAAPIGQSASRLKAAAKGTALAAAGLVGRKATSDNPTEQASWNDPSSYLNSSDLINLGIGAGGGALFGKAKSRSSTPEAPKPPSNWEDLHASNPTDDQLDAFLKTRKIKGEDIHAEAKRLEALGNPEMAQRLRQSAARTSTGNSQVYSDATSTAKKDVKTTQDDAAADVLVKDEQARKAAQDQAAWVKDQIAEVKKMEAAKKAEAKATKANVDINSGITDAVDESTAKATEAQLAQEKLDALMAKGAKKTTVARKTVKGIDPETGETTQVTETIAPKRSKKDLNGGAAPSGPAPVEGKYQVVDANGRPIASLDTEDEVSELMAAGAGKGYKVILPKGITASAPPVPSKGAAPIAAKPADAPFNPPKMVEPKVEAPVAAAPPTTPPTSQASVAPIVDKSVTPANQDVDAIFHGSADDALKAAGPDLTKNIEDALARNDRGAILRFRALLEALPEEEFQKYGSHYDRLDDAIIRLQKGLPPATPEETAKILAERTKSPAAPDEGAVAPTGGYPEPKVGTIPQPGEVVEGNPETSNSLWQDLLQRLRVGAKNPANGSPEANIGMYDPKRGGLVIQPKEGGGYLRDEFDSSAIKHSETRSPANKAGVGAKFAPDELDPTQIKADLDNIQDPLVRQMAEREIARLEGGAAPAPKMDPIEAITSKPSVSAPKEILDEITAFKAKQNELLSKATSQEEVRAITEQLGPEADALQLKLTLAEREAEKSLGSRLKGERGAVTGTLPNISSEAMRHLLMSAGGAGIGAYDDKDDPLRGALVGGGLGFLGSKALGRFNSEGPTQPVSLGDRIVNLNRFAKLANFPNVVVNSIAPGGGAAMSSLENILAGKIAKSGLAQRLSDSGIKLPGGMAVEAGREVGDAGLEDLGKNGLKELFNRKNYTLDKLHQYSDEARELLERAEGGDKTRSDVVGTAPSIIDKVMRMPAAFMTTGDTGARHILGGAGWSEQAARLATLTNEPRYALTKQIPNIARSGGTLGRLLLPFSKTAANAIESSAERIPLVGFAFQRSGINPEAQASIAELIARQGMGAGVGAIAYEMGKHMDPETAKNNKMAMIITNMAGQYGPLAAAAFTAGQASQNGDSTKDTIIKGASHLLQDLPLPTTESAKELISTGASYAAGEPPNPNKSHEILQWLPKTFTPGFINDDTLDQQDQIFGSGKTYKRLRP